jgi:hypothetical protein
MSDNLMAGSTEEQLTLFAEDSLASHSAWPGSEQARMMTVTSGRKCIESYLRFSQVTSLVKMLLGSSIWNSTLVFLTWKQSVTPAGRLLFRLVPSMPSTEGIESGFLPTPTATANQACPSMQKHAANRRLMWATPAASNGGAINPERAEDGWEWTGQYWKKPDGRKHQTNLLDQARMMPTPIAHWSKETGAPSEKNLNSPTLASEFGGRLNPEWVEWLMGFPVGWTDLSHSETP